MLAQSTEVFITYPITAGDLHFDFIDSVTRQSSVFSLMSSGYMRTVWCVKLKIEMTQILLPPGARNTSNPVGENAALHPVIAINEKVWRTCDRGSSKGVTSVIVTNNWSVYLKRGLWDPFSYCHHYYSTLNIFNECVFLL